MSYEPIREILSALDLQQRQEMAALSGLVDAAELERVRDAKKRLFTSSVFFIERSWEVIAPSLDAFSLEAECGKTTEELRAYLAALRHRGPSFAWGWVRARMDARLMQWLEACVPDLLAQYPQQAALYEDTLRNLHPYWFRETPLHHLKAGYHTALGAACKWYGSAFEMIREAGQSCLHATRPFPAELRRFASFSLTMLVRTDGYLWDSAGARPLDAVCKDETLNIASNPIEELSLAAAPDYGLRLGCPALRARGAAGLPAFDGILAWVEQVFSLHLLEPGPA